MQIYVNDTGQPMTLIQCSNDCSIQRAAHVSSEKLKSCQIISQCQTGCDTIWNSIIYTISKQACRMDREYI